MDRKKRALKLNKNFEFRRAYKGKFKAGPLLVTYVVKNRYKTVRFGITATKKIGKAHLRNRARRVIAAAARENLPKVRGGYDIVFVSRGKTPYVKSQQISRHMEKQLSALLGDCFEKNTSGTD